MAINAYFAENPDVAAAYSQNSSGMTPDQFAQTHYNKYGQYEQRAAPTSASADPIVTAWQNAESSGDYSQIAGLIGNMSGQQLMSIYGLSPSDLNYINNQAGTSLMPISGNTLSNAASSVSSSAVLTPEIASNLMQRSMTTGVPTSEFDRYGGFDAVAAMYNQNNGTYSLDNLSPDFLDQVDNTIANSGVGNLSVLKMTGEPLTKAGRQAMINNGVSFTDADLKAMQIPYEGFLQAPTSGSGSSAGPQLASGSADLSQVSNGGREWGTPETVGASNGQLMGAGNANYNSSLIRALRQSSMNPFSTNPGVQMTPNAGQTTVNWTPPAGQGSAFNPQVFNPRAATPQEVTDWNAYNAYRSSSVSASNPYLSLTDWIAQGRPTGVNNTSSGSGDNQSYED